MRDLGVILKYILVGESCQHSYLVPFMVCRLECMMLLKNISNYNKHEYDNKEELCMESYLEIEYITIITNNDNCQFFRTSNNA